MKTNYFKKQVLNLPFFLIVLLCFFYNTIGITQDQIAHKLNVRITNLAYLPEIEGEGADQTIIFTHPAMIALMSPYIIKGFERAYPLADEMMEHELGEELSRVYQIEIEENETALYTDLMNDGIAFFDRINYQYEAHSLLTDPDDFDTTGVNSGKALNKISIREAWDYSYGDPSIKIAIVEASQGGNGFEITHEDFVNENGSSQIAYVDPGANTSPGASFHGTRVAGIAGAAVNNEKGMTGTGFRCRLMLYSTLTGNPYNTIMHAAVDGANIINISWYSTNCQFDQNEQDVITLLSDYFDCIFVAAAANGNQGSMMYPEACDGGPNVGLMFLSPGASVFRNGYAYPASYAGVFSVGGSNLQDSFVQGTTNHSFNDRVDITAPSFTVTAPTVGNSYDNTGSWGTSYATPLVSGVAGLILAENDCYSASSVLDIIKSTTDDIYGLHANSAYKGYGGTGRLNAYEALLAAQTYLSEGLDLYIKDRPEDLGVSGGYHWQADRDNSSDIWVRNQADGFDKQESQDPEYQIATPVYVYVRVRNKSCVASTGTEELALYWTKASSWSSWPQNWDGTSPAIGDQINSLTIPVIAPGEEVILEFEWSILSPWIYDTWATCLLARVENSIPDPITIYPNNISKDVYFNNNIAMKNLTVIDVIPGIGVPGGLGGLGFSEISAAGNTMYIGNPNSSDETYDFSFTEDVFSENALQDVAELRILFEETGWDFMSSSFIGREADGIKISGEREVTLTNPSVLIEDITIPAETRFPIHVCINFLTEMYNTNERNNYKFHVRQFADDGEILGGEHFEFNRHPRDIFTANAGEDITVHLGGIIEIEGEHIDEEASYKWYDEANEIIGETSGLSLTPTASTTLRYEVISEEDGYKDYDEVLINVLDQWINSVSPNPATDILNVSYNAFGASVSQLRLTNVLTNEETIMAIDPILDGLASLNILGFVPGTYSVALISDAILKDSKLIVIL